MSHSPDLKSPEQGKPAVNAGRRRFARAGAAAPVVLGTLASQPVLATGGGTKPPYHCTISGQMSGNLSRAPDSTNCKTLGRSPGYWKNHAWPSGVKGSLPSSGCTMASGTSLGTLFSAKFMHAFSRKSVSGTCVMYDLRQPASFNATASSSASMLEVLNYGGGLNEKSLKALGRAAVASWLNAHQFGLAYPLTAAKVVAMFNAVAPSGGLYKVNASTSWDSVQVQNYFESLYGAL